MKVTKKDSRPVGSPDECFYCNQPIGSDHEYECICNTKRVRVVYSFEVKKDFPKYWDEERILFNMNESSWCANNTLDELKKLGKKIGCLCSVFDGRLALPKDKR